MRRRSVCWTSPTSSVLAIAALLFASFSLSRLFLRLSVKDTGGDREREEDEEATAEDEDKDDESAAGNKAVSAASNCRVKALTVDKSLSLRVVVDDVGEGPGSTGLATGATTTSDEESWEDAEDVDNAEAEPRTAEVTTVGGWVS